MAWVQMKGILIASILGIVMIQSGCTSSSWYAGHPTTREELIRAKGPPHHTSFTDDGKEKLVYQFEGEGTVYMFWLIEDGRVVRTGLE